MSVPAGSPSPEQPPAAATPGIPDPPLPFTGGRIPVSEPERGRVEWLDPDLFRRQFESLFGNPWPFDHGRVVRWMSPGETP